MRAKSGEGVLRAIRATGDFVERAITIMAGAGSVQRGAYKPSENSASR